MCSEWLKEESSSAFNSWKFHAIRLSIITLELFSSNISRHPELFVLFLPFMNHSLFSRPPWPQELHLPSWGLKLGLNKWTLGNAKTGSCPHLPSNPWLISRHTTKRSGWGLIKDFFGPTKSHKGNKWVFLTFQLMFLGTQLLHSIGVSDISSPFSAAQVNLVTGMVGDTGKELQAIFLLFHAWSGVREWELRGNNPLCGYWALPVLLLRHRTAKEFW